MHQWKFSLKRLPSYVPAARVLPSAENARAQTASQRFMPEIIFPSGKAMATSARIRSVAGQMIQGAFIFLAISSLAHVSRPSPKTSYFCERETEPSFESELAGH